MTMTSTQTNWLRNNGIKHIFFANEGIDMFSRGSYSFIVDGPEEIELYQETEDGPFYRGSAPTLKKALAMLLDATS